MVRVVPGQGGSSDLSEEDFIHVAVQLDSRDSNDFVLNELNDSSSSYDDDNFLVDEPIHRGSITGHRTVDHVRLLWHYLLYRDYFSENPIFDLEFFRRR
jgi:hypothetical protein